jgi:hypothetical protein
MEASTMGLNNLKRILPNLIEWSYVEGMPFDDLEEIYGQVYSQFGRYIRHVATNVGGVYEYRKTADEDGIVFTPVEREKQARAVAWLNTNVFTTPSWLLDEDILARISPDGAVDRIHSLQTGALNRLMEIDRLERLLEGEARYGAQAYSITSLFNDTRTGIFADLNGRVQSDLFRRNLQRSYVEKMAELMKEEEDDVQETEIPALARMTLMELDSQLEDTNASDARVRAHYADLRARIEAAMDDD